MTLTLRSASTTTGTTKGAALTHAEMDANWLHVAQSANVGFVQSGSGALSEPVQTTLRRLLFAGQYSSIANFNTARAAHTGTVALPPTSQFANLDATATTPFSLISGGGTFNGTYDPVLYVGYNIGGANGNTKITSAEPMLKLSLEADFNDATNHLMEFNLDYTSADGLVTRRPIYVNVGRSGPSINAVGMAFTYGGSVWDIAHTDGTTVFRFFDSKTLTINGTTEVSGVKLLVNGNVIRQRNESASRYRSDHQIGSFGLVLNAFDDTGGVYLPSAFDFLPAVFNQTSLGNMGLGTSTFGTNATLTFGVKTGTAPTTGVADTVQIYSSDNSAGNTILSIFTEGTEAVMTGQADSVSANRVRMRVNGTVYQFLCV